jgi:short-subunit dehydrogenase
MSEKSCLVIGGTSGLGFEIAKQFRELGDRVVITGRQNPKEYGELDLGPNGLVKRIEELVKGLPRLNSLVYAAGYYQEGRITDLSEEEIETMLNVGERGLIYSVRAILNKQDELDELITITSTSQWTPRQKEPAYNAAKAAAGHFSNGMAEDGRIKKVLVAGPAGMQTKFWDGVERDDLHTMMDPTWVAEQVIKLRNSDKKYRFARILREPQRVELVEER